MYSNVKLQIKGRRTIIFWRRWWNFGGHKQFVSVSLSLQSDFSNCIILACVAGGFLDGAGVFLFCGSQSKTYSRAKAEPSAEPWSKQRTMGEGTRGEGHCLRAQYIIPMNQLTLIMSIQVTNPFGIYFYTLKIYFTFISQIKLTGSWFIPDLTIY